MLAFLERVLFQEVILLGLKEQKSKVVGKKTPFVVEREKKKRKKLNHYPFLELSLEDITVERRKQRRQKKQKAPVIEHDDALTAIELRELTEEKDVEMCQLDMYEAYFLLYALNVLEIKTVNQVKKNNLYIERPQCQFIKCQKAQTKYNRMVVHILSIRPFFCLALCGLSLLSKPWLGS
jgi:hypothetical protein